MLSHGYSLSENVNKVVQGTHIWYMPLQREVGSSSRPCFPY